MSDWILLMASLLRVVGRSNPILRCVGKALIKAFVGANPSH